LSIFIAAGTGVSFDSQKNFLKFLKNPGDGKMKGSAGRGKWLRGFFDGPLFFRRI
jgi:hypothetical protein